MGQPLVIRRRLGPMSDMRDQRLRRVKLNWNLAHITHPHTRHPSLITVATKQTFRRFDTLSLPHRTPTSHLHTPSQPHNNPPLLSRLLPLSSRLLNRGPRLFLLPEVRVQWVWLHTGRGVATQDLLSWWRDTISDSVYVCFLHSHSLPFDYVHNITSPTVLHYVYILFVTNNYSYYCYWFGCKGKKYKVCMYWLL